jgi:hypothetical protein
VHCYGLQLAAGWPDRFLLAAREGVDVRRPQNGRTAHAAENHRRNERFPEKHRKLGFHNRQNKSAIDPENRRRGIVGILLVNVLATHW